MKKLPNTIFVALENPGHATDEFLNAQKSPSHLVEMNETKEIGEYVLKRRVEVRGEANELREIG